MNAQEQLWRQGLEGTLGVPFSPSNQIEVLRNGVEIFPAMLEAVEQATRSIDMLTYVYWTGSIAERFATALSERASAGIKVRLLLDADSGADRGALAADRGAGGGGGGAWRGDGRSGRRRGCAPVVGAYLSLVLL